MRLRCIAAVILALCASVEARAQKWASDDYDFALYLIDNDLKQDALTMLKAILDEEPYDSEAWNLLAETYIALEKLPEALEAAD
ncbi:MAG: tetratricopeptide repeat protein [Bacteroidales bacterium]|nr:tetratricopeptide repeat protein [Bacteroidales bacterium]